MSIDVNDLRQGVLASHNLLLKVLWLIYIEIVALRKDLNSKKKKR